MKKHAYVLIIAAIAATLSFSQDRDRDRRDNPQFNEHDQQVAHDWYNQHAKHPPAGFRDQDRLTPEEESRLREGAVLDNHLRSKMHAAPADLYRQLPPPPPRHRYVAVGGHVALIDNGYHVKGVIRLHENHDNH
jgi:Ni/Co efflux regulator RcnB